MERKLIHKLTFEVLVVILVSVVLLSAFSFLSSDDSEQRIQQNYSEVFNDVLVADYYEELSISDIDSYEGLNAVYEGFAADGSPIGFITDVMVVTNNNTELHLLTGITYDGAELTGISRINDEDNPVPMTDEEIALIVEQARGSQIPIYVNNDNEIINNQETPVNRIIGLNDGVYYAQALEEDNHGYMDYVELEIQNGMIVRVQWDAFNIETTTKNRIEASLSGAFQVSGESWATQSYNLCHALIDCQDPALLAMRSDGTTTIIDGVTIPIDAFVNLTVECINNSINEFDKDDYFEALDEIVGNLMGSDPEMLGYYNRDGFLVFSFEDYPSVFTVCDEEENVIGMSNVRLLAEGDEGEIIDYSYYTTSSGYGYSNNITDITVIGAEDGINVGSMTAEGNGIDGIPASEIRTYIDGIPGSYQRTRYVITAVNLSYRFLKDYLNWMA